MTKTSIILSSLTNLITLTIAKPQQWTNVGVATGPLQGTTIVDTGMGSTTTVVPLTGVGSTNLFGDPNVSNDATLVTTVDPGITTNAGDSLAVPIDSTLTTQNPTTLVSSTSTTTTGISGGGCQYATSCAQFTADCNAACQANFGSLCGSQLTNVCAGILQSDTRICSCSGTDFMQSISPLMCATENTGNVGNVFVPLGTTNTGGNLQSYPAGLNGGQGSANTGITFVGVSGGTGGSINNMVYPSSSINTNVATVTVVVPPTTTLNTNVATVTVVVPPTTTPTTNVATVTVVVPPTTTPTTDVATVTVVVPPTTDVATVTVVVPPTTTPTTNVATVTVVVPPTTTINTNVATVTGVVPPTTTIRTTWVAATTPVIIPGGTVGSATTTIVVGNPGNVGYESPAAPTAGTGNVITTITTPTNDQYVSSPNANTGLGGTTTTTIGCIRTCIEFKDLCRQSCKDSYGASGFGDVLTNVCYASFEGTQNRQCACNGVDLTNSVGSC